MNVTAGVGGPAITLYAVSTGWEHRRFVGSIQLYFAVLNLGSIAAKGFPPDRHGRIGRGDGGARPSGWQAAPSPPAWCRSLAPGRPWWHWLWPAPPQRW